MESEEYYDGTELLNKRDINGDKPEVYLVNSNRSDGKTTYFNRYFTNRYIKKNEQFMLIHRYNYQAADSHKKFFSELEKLFFKNYKMTIKPLGMCKGVHQLFLNNRLCGFSAGLNAAENIKEYSHLFSDVYRMKMDEYISENGVYTNHEVDKLISIHTSVARGNGQHRRYVPLFLIGNKVSLINPYFEALGIDEKMLPEEGFYRGSGFVGEVHYNTRAALAIEASGLIKAFKNNTYAQTLTTNEFMYDNAVHVIKMSLGEFNYMATLKLRRKKFALYGNNNMLYISNHYDPRYPVKLTDNLDEDGEGFENIRKYPNIMHQLETAVRNGYVRYESQICKNLFIKAVSLCV